MTALAPGGDFYIHVALLGHTDDRVGLVHTVHRFVEHRAALVQGHGEPDTLVFQMTHDGGSAVAAGFFIDREGQIDIPAGNISFFQQLLDSLQLCEHGALAVQSAPAVEAAALHFAAESAHAPALVRGGDHVLMAHQQNGLAAAAACPAVEQTSVEDGFFQLFVNQREAFLQNLVKAEKIGQVLMLRLGNRGDTDHCAQLVGAEIKVFRCIFCHRGLL